MTTEELIEYLQGFPPESYITMIALDTHQERKYAFRVEHLSLITGEAFPQMWLHIDKEAPVDVLRGRRGLMKETCKNCAHCRPSYKGGVCEVKNKKVKLSGPKERCGDFRPKS